MIRKKDDFYYKNIGNCEILVSDENNSNKNDEIQIYNHCDIIPSSFEEERNLTTFYYISDIHLDYKIKNKFPKSATKEEITNYIHDLVQNMCNSLGKELFSNRYLLIDGDVSYSFEISKIFYQELLKIKQPSIISPSRVIAILGNHELWNFENFDECLESYKKFFDDIGITFIQDELLIICDYIHRNKIKLNRDEILSLTDEELREKTINNNIVILGGLGFSGYNKTFNANNKLYRNTIKSLDEDIMRTKEFEEIYLKVKKSLHDRNVIVLTHTPKNNWSTDNYNSNWTYINGHTHQNYYCKNDDMILYADNQIGYFNDNVILKSFNQTKKYDIFRYYKDGIYVLDVDKYKEYYRGLGIFMTYNRNDGIIKMIKRDNIYCFLLEKEKNLYLLDGGKRKKLVNNDIQYYYNNMSAYSNLLKQSTNDVDIILRKISNAIKTIGGSGIIHGCIVDIDYYNHIYLNIYDGTITPYFAINTIEKYAYSNFDKFLEDNCPNLYLNYKNQLLKDSSLILKSNKIDLYNVELITNTNIYKPSNIMKSIQYLTNDNIIRIWNDNIINNELQPIMIDNK